MRITLACVGRLKAGAERDLAARYLARADAAARSVGLIGVDLREAQEGRGRSADERRAEEARALRAILPGGGRLVVLDARGAAKTSEDFAADIARARDGGGGAYALALGGPDGLDAALRDDADLVLAFGAMTWPHQLARIMAAEQVYRATTILAGHPYHRA